MASGNTALILGATGGIGGEVALQLRDSGWTIRALKRSASEAKEDRDGITWIRGDAMNAEDVREAAEGCSVIVHAVNPARETRQHPTDRRARAGTSHPTR